MHKGLVILAALALVACKKTGDNEYEVVRPGLVTDTVRTPTVGSTLDTIRTPVIGTKKDTIIVNKPVIGTKQTVVRKPIVKKP